MTKQAHRSRSNIIPLETTSSSSEKASSVGRQRSTDATDCVLKFALALAYEGGLANATIERIAQKSGVAKTTIYRRWPSAGAVVMDAFVQEISPLISYKEKQSIVASFRAALKELIVAFAGQRGKLLRELLGAAQSDAGLQRTFWENWNRPRRALARDLVSRAQQRNEMRRDIDEDVLIDMIFGSIYYRMLVPYAPLDANYVDELVIRAFRGSLPPEAPPSDRVHSAIPKSRKRRRDLP